jgi:hypothetical protein
MPAESSLYSWISVEARGAGDAVRCPPSAKADKQESHPHRIPHRLRRVGHVVLKARASGTTRAVEMINKVTIGAVVTDYVYDAAHARDYLPSSSRILFSNHTQ